MKARKILPPMSLLAVLILLIGNIACQEKEGQDREGYVDVPGGKVWYRIEGEGENPPVLILHGGPGSSSYGLETLKQLGENRRVIFYDQLGCGRSDRITDTTLMTVNRYVEEVEALRNSLNLDDFYLYGHSWGTMLGIDYYMKYPEHIRAIIFSSPLFSTDLWIRDADTLIATLADSVQQAIRVNEERGTFENPEYQDAVSLYYSYFLRRKKRPQAQIDSARMFFGTNVYEYMWGPSEFTARGTLADYDRLSELADIKVPVLLLTGEFDEARPTTVAYYQSLIPGAAFEVIPGSGHVTPGDNPKATLEAIGAFLERYDP
jgi:proline iminopeptidase